MKPANAPLVYLPRSRQPVRRHHRRGRGSSVDEQQEQREYIEVRPYTGEEIYLPIWEEKSVPLEVQLGCGWHQCKFCDFANDPRHVFSLAEVEAKASMIAPYMKDQPRVFLLGENALMLPMEHLRGIMDIIGAYFPRAFQVASYARFDDIMRKTDDELEELADLGLCEVHIGLESGCQDVLDFMNKGIDLDDALRACERLHDIGIDFSFTMIAGLGGTKLWERHALESARFLNASQPKRIWLTGLLLWPDTPLFHIAEEGGFEQLTFRERLREVREMVAALELDDCMFVDSTVLGDYTVHGHLPDQKADMLKAMDHLLVAEGPYDVVPPIPTKSHR